MASTKDICERLREFARGTVHGMCRDQPPDNPCDVMAASAYESYLCEGARALLAEATPEVVRRADAAPDLVAALEQVRAGLGDRLLAGGPLSKGYADAILVEIAYAMVKAGAH